MRKQTPKRNTKGGFVQDRSQDYNQNMLKVEKPPSNAKQQQINKQNQSQMSNFTQKTQASQPKAHLVSHGATPSGDGLWCVVKEEDYYEPGKYDQIAQKAINRKTKVVENKIESTVIEGLEKQCQELGFDLEKANGIAREKNLENLQLKQIVDNLNKTINEQMTEIMRLRNSNNTVDQQVEEVKDKFNQLRREHDKLQQDYEEEKSKAETFQQYYNEISEESKKKIIELQGKLKKSMQYQDELVEENEELLNQIQNKQIIHKKKDEKRENEFQQQTQKQQMETTRKLEKMGKLLEENATLSEKLNESEILRKKFMEKNQMLDKEIRKLCQEKLEIEKQVVQLQKRNKDLSVLKSQGTKVLDEKIKDLNAKIQQLEKENKILNKKIQNSQKNQKIDYQEYDDEEELEEVQAKPQLFGPIDTGKY